MSLVKEKFEVETNWIKVGENYKDIQENIKIYVTPCHKEFDSRHHDLNHVENHILSCPVCKIVLGKSHAMVLNQDDVARCFALRLGEDKSNKTIRDNPFRHTATNHLRVEDKELIHYSTYSAIITDDDKLIENTQDWSSGFANVPNIPDEFVDARLPLTTLRGALIGLHNIKLIEVKGGWRNEVLFSDDDNYYLFGHDEGSGDFVVKLPDKCSSVHDAYMMLKPIQVKEYEVESGKEALRQGDIFFIPCELPKDAVIVKQKYEKGKDYGYDKDGDWILKDVKVLHHLEILEKNDLRSVTRHEVTRMVYGEPCFVTGKVYHPEHETLDLNGWFKVYKNTAIISYNANRRNARGFD